MEAVELKDLLLKALVASIRAGEVILRVYDCENHQIDLKEDQSPVTLADRRSHSVISDILAETGWPVLSEEAAEIPYHIRKDWSCFWLIDPLDGTKEFIKRNGEFTVNIALVQNRAPVLGIVYTPVKRLLFFGLKQTGSYRMVLPDNKEFPSHPEEWIRSASRLPVAGRGKKMKVVASRSHMSPETLEYIEHLNQKYGDVKMVSRGSSMKICMVAEGEAQIYPRLGPTMEWDTAAGQAIAEAAGCSMTQYGSGDPVVYNKEDLLNPWFVVKSKEM